MKKFFKAFFISIGIIVAALVLTFATIALDEFSPEAALTVWLIILISLFTYIFYTKIPDDEEGTD